MSVTAGSADVKITANAKISNGYLVLTGQLLRFMNVFPDLRCISLSNYLTIYLYFTFIAEVLYISTFSAGTQYFGLILSINRQQNAHKS